MTMTPDFNLDVRRRRTVVWIVTLATVGLIFDGYDLVVYGTVVSTFLRDPSHIGNVTPATAGALGSYALAGVLAGAMLAGTVGDILGRRKVMLFAYAWFSVGMAITATTSAALMFGWMRFVTGLGVGALVATTGALVSEYAWLPRNQTKRRNFRNTPYLARACERETRIARGEGDLRQDSWCLARVLAATRLEVA